MLVTKIKKI